MTAVTVISFGFLHGPAPEAEATFDARRFRDPHLDPGLRELTGDDLRVQAAVLGTPGVPALIRAACAAVAALLSADRAGPVTIAVGCAGGRHRAPVIAGAVAGRLGPGAVTEHRDITRPVLRSTR